MMATRVWLAARWLSGWLICGLLLSLLAAPAGAMELRLPALTDRVLDTTKTLSAAQQAALTERLAALEQATGAQVAILMVPSTGAQDIEGFAVQAFETWKLGRQDVDDGVLIVVAKDDRAMRLEVGYGLEGVVTDAVASRLIRDTLAPAFGVGDFAGGLDGAVTQLSTLIESGELPPPSPTAIDEDSGLTLFVVVVIAIVMILRAVPAPVVAVLVFAFTQSVILALIAGIVMFVLNRLLHRVSTQVVRQHGASYRRGGWTGGGWSGGSSRGRSSGGGFRGGGGRSGGGGASGRW